MKTKLPNVTLFIADCINVTRAIAVLEKCQEHFEFGAVKLLTSIPSKYEHAVKIKPLNSLIAYSVFMLTRAHEYIDTQFALVVQRDGFIINPEAWDNSWLERYDYIAPLFVQYPKVGSGGFSLRSKRLMVETSKNTPIWDWSQKEAERIQEKMGMYEDGVISLSGKYSSFNIAPPEEAMKFAQGGCPDERYYYPHPFGFHGVLNNIDHSTGFVSPVCSHNNNPHCNCAIDHINFLQANEA